MTSQSSTTNIKRAGFAPLFNFTAKQCWTTILLFTIILFFILPVPVLLIISNRVIDSADDLIRLRNQFANDWVSVIRYFVIIAVSIFGIVLSCARFGYLKNKVSIDFYHSLPVKRRQLFLTQLGVALISLVIPYIFNTVFTLLVIAANGLISETLLLNVLIMSAETFIYSTFFFSLSTLVGMISGLGAVHLALTVVAMYVIPVIYLVSVAFVGIFSENFWFDYYLDASFFEKTTPALRFLLNSDSLNITESSVLLLISAAMLIGSYAIYMTRKSERAGTPVVFTPLGEIIKYILVYIGTLCGGLLFYGMTEDGFWTIFGMACGMILVFMLANTILNKTARAMFKGWKGLIIFGIAAAIAFIMLITNAFGINTSVPNPDSTSRVEVNFGSDISGLEFHDKEVIKALHTIYTERGYYRPGYIYGIKDSYEIFSLDIVFYPKFGIPVAKSIRIYNKSDFIEEFKTILDSEEFREQYSSVIDTFSKIGTGHLNLQLPHYTFDDEGNASNSNFYNHWRYDSQNPLAQIGKSAGLTYLAQENKACSFDFFQQQSVGFLNIYSSSGTYRDVCLPIFASMDGLIEHYIDISYLSDSHEEYLEHLAGAITSLKVYKESDGDSMTVTDKEQIHAILKASADPYGDYSDSTFTFIDTDYSIEYEIEVTDYTGKTYYEKYDGTVYVDGDAKSTYTTSHTAAFLLGKTPGFVIKYFN